MEMSMGKILNKLKKDNSELYVNRQECILINNIKLYKQNQLNFKPDTLYVMKPSTILNLLPEMECVNILCVGKCNNCLEKAQELNINMLVLNDNEELEVAVDEIQNILDRHRQLLRNTAILFEMLAEGNGLQQIMNKGYEMLGNMVLLTDMSMNVVLISENAKMDDDLKKWIYEDPTESYNNFYVKQREKRGFEKSYKAKTPIYISKDVDRYAYLSSHIYVNDKQVGHLTIVEFERNFEEDDYELISLLSKVVSLEMQKDRLICNSRGFLYESLFLDLLEGRVKDPIIIEDRIKSLDIDLEENLYVFTIVVSKDEQTNTNLSFIRNLLEDMIKSSKSVIYNDNIMFLITASNDEKPLLKVNLKKLKNFLQNNKIHSGLSYCFHSLKDLQEYYKQSLKAIEMGIHLNKEEVIFPYEDYVKYHIMDVCSKNENLKTFCHPSILKLLEYDRIYNTDFTNSLYTYLIYEKSQKETAEALHIHRSTLLYRIKKAEEIMNINLKSSGLVFNLLVSFKILEFIGEVKFITCIDKE
ncbi:helix-turn-helix domain-containing protein [Clostridium sp. PL3]|uniref:Helix-turn-helix domain-containing protein n=1 Tax=Clostridium thailandense TaxID=2794346 RepID=A0A949TYQ9_9CLOT|nr:helix-turn-helix domain-containing protein [Clostridium thailandense]MBV7276086.1 helix-turn-helix domain-containing protein [Clostridium thailandense]